MAFEKSIRFLSINIVDLKVTGLGLRLFSLEKSKLSYFYKLIKTQNLDSTILKFDKYDLRLDQIDLCFYHLI